MDGSSGATLLNTDCLVWGARVRLAVACSIIIVGCGGDGKGRGSVESASGTAGIGEPVGVAGSSARPEGGFAGTSLSDGGSSAAIAGAAGAANAAVFIGTVPVVGVVLDVDQRPIAGARVEQLQGAEATTDDEGHFLVLGAPEAPPTLIARADGFMMAERALDLSNTAGISVPTITLLPIAAVAEIDGAVGGVVGDPSSGVMVSVPRGAFVGTHGLSVAIVPVGDPLLDDDRLPLPLPSIASGALAPLFGIVVDSEGVQPTQAVEITIRVPVDLPASTQVPVGRYDVDLGQWIDVGLAAVTAEGDLRFSTEHLSTFTGALPATPTVPTLPPELARLDQMSNLMVPGEPRVDIRTGGLLIGVELPGLIRRNERLSLTLFHDSRTLASAMDVNITVNDAMPGETLLVKANTPQAQLRVEAQVAGSGTNRSAGSITLPATGSRSPGAAPTEALADFSAASVTVSRPVSATLNQSESNSFSKPEAGPPLTTDIGERIQASAPVPISAHRSNELVRENRSNSPFGRGWHLMGLTRLLQPHCHPDRPVVIGRFDDPGRVYRPADIAYALPLAAALEAGGLQPSALANEDVHVARTAEATYVGLGNAGQVWRVANGDSSSTKLFDIAESPALGTEAVWAMAPSPTGNGAFVATSSSVVRIDADGIVERIVGTVGGPAPANGGLASEAGFEGLNGVVPAPDGQSMVVSTLANETWLVGSEGTLSQLRTRASHPHGIIGAYSPDGELIYTATGSPCVYRHVDGLNDPEVFADCNSTLVGPIQDGPAQSAGVAQVSSVSFDDEGSLVVVDGAHRAVRKLDRYGMVTTLTLPAVVPGAASLLGVGGPAADATLATANRVSAASADKVSVAAPGAVVELTYPPGMSIGSDDGAVLRQNPDGTWTRQLADGQQEQYDIRGLLVRRGRHGAPGLDYEYQPWSAEISEDVCGQPAQPPKLQRILMQGETLFTLEYAAGGLIAVQDAAGRRTSLTWGSANAPIAFELPSLPQSPRFDYDPSGRITMKTVDGGNATSWQTGYEYTDGRLWRVTMPGRMPLEYGDMAESTRLDAAELGPGGISRTGVLDVARATLPGRSGSATVELGADSLRVTSAAGQPTELETDEQGRLKVIRNADGSELHLTRDPSGRILEMLNASTGDVWRYDYSPSTGLLIARTDPGQRLTQYVHDGEGRIQALIELGGATRTFVYGSAQGSSIGQPVRITDTLGRETQLSYDLAGNLSQIDAPGGAVTLIERDAVGRAVRVVEPTGVVRTSSFDVRDGVILSGWGEGDSARLTTSSRQVSNAWEAIGSQWPASALVGVSDAEGREWDFERDAAYRIVRLQSPGDGEVTQTFDPDSGLRTRRASADGSTTYYSYDSAGRLVRRYADGPAVGQELRLQYDELGRVSTLSDSLVVESRSFEPGVGWTRMHLEPTPDSGIEAALTFDLSRSRLSAVAMLQGIQDESAYQVTQGQNGLTEEVAISTLSDPVQRLVWSATYDGELRPADIERGNGTSSHFTLDAEGRVTRQEESHAGGVLVVEYTWDTAGRPASRTIDGVERVFGYDRFGQLSGCSDTAESYTYDSVGARASSSSGQYTRGSRGQLLADPQYLYEYDQLGRRVSRLNQSDATDRQEYLWGAAGLLSEVLQGPSGSATAVASFLYDGTGRRIVRRVGSETWLYSYLPDTDRPVRIVEPSGAAWHLVHATESAAYTVAVSTDGRERYVHLDVTGRVLGVSDESGALSLVDEDCYGKRRTLVDASVLLDVGFHGMFYDEETATYVAGPRSYDPITGEFLSPDPEGFEGGTAPWSYAGGNPAVAQDPSGRLFFVAVGALLAGYKIYAEIRDFSQSAEVSRAKRSYDAMTELDEPDALEQAEKAHSRLSKAADKGGDAAIKATKTAVEAVTNPTKDAGDFVDTVKEELGDALGEAINGSPAGDGDEL